jgi:GTPase SAR1 family protein
MESKNKNGNNEIDYSFYEKLVVIGDKKVGKTTLIENLFSIKESNIEKETSKNKKLLITV